MSYDVIMSPRAIKNLKDLPVDETERIISTLEQIQDKTNNSVNEQNVSLYSLHIGDHMILLDIIPGKLLILEVRIGHSRDIYK
jgi:mRNA-degrading endonuclease RelE of RelBE toxin-antitoxin system